MTEKEYNLMRRAMGLEYSSYIPEDSELTHLELCALIEDYDLYVHECIAKGVEPKNHEEFKGTWNLILNAELNKMNTGNKVYIFDKNDVLTETFIIYKGITESGISCYVNNNEYDFVSGELYKKNKRWD